MKITSKNIYNESRLFDIIKNVTYKQMRGKLASAILYLTSEELLEEQVFSHLNRQGIADFAAITLESTVKFIKEFEKVGIIKLDGKNIKVNNEEDLLMISKKG